MPGSRAAMGNDREDIIKRNMNQDMASDKL